MKPTPRNLTLVLIVSIVMVTVIPTAQAQSAPCGFVPNRTLRGTDTLTPGIWSTVVILQSGQVYPVVAISDDRVNVAVDNASGAWVNLADGQLRGDCTDWFGVVPSPTRTPSTFSPQPPMVLPSTPPTNSSTRVACLFIPLGPVIGTDTLNASANSSTASLNPGQSYTVFALQDGKVNVAVDNGFGVWVNGTAGTLQGDCVQFAAPHGVYTPQFELGLKPISAASCVFVPATATVGSASYTSDPDAIIVNLTGGQAYAVVALTAQQVQITVDGLFHAWVHVTAGQVLGTCDTLAAATAVALDGARLWSKPNVRTGEVIAAVPAQTTFVVIDGPVNGSIRLDTNATGDWYFVQVATSSQSGWLWQARLQFTN